MYKRIAVAAMMIITSCMGPIIYAEGEDDMSLMLNDTQIDAIRANCVDTQAMLTRIFSNDILARVHLGGEYDTISTKYMAPMNSRVALNKLDGVALTKTSVEFNNHAEAFRDRYQVYKETMSRLNSMKCKDQPVGFYDGLTQARSQRAALHESVATLNTLAKQYSAQVGELKVKASAKKLESK